MHPMRLRMPMLSICIMIVLLMTSVFLLGGCADIESTDSLERKKAVQRISDKQLLLKVAIYDEASFVRMAATRKLEEEDMIDAIDELNDQSILANVAISTSGEVRKAALDKITDADVMARIACYASCSKSSVSAAALDRLSDDTNALLSIIIDDCERCVREAALIKLRRKIGSISNLVDSLEQEEHLSRVAAVTDNCKLGCAIVEKMVDQKLLSEIVTKNTPECIGMAVVEKLTDENYLANVVGHSNNGRVELAAARKISDQRLLVKIAGWTRTCGKSIVNMITDEELLYMLLMDTETNYSQEAQVAAVGKITDQDKLYNIWAVQYDLSFAAINQITNESILRRISKEYKRSSHLRIGDYNAKKLLSIKLMCNDPIIVHSLGKLDVEYHIDKRTYSYGSQSQDARIWVERIQLLINDYNHVNVVDLVFKGKDAPERAAFDMKKVNRGLSSIYYNRAEVNLKQVASELVIALPRDAIVELSESDGMDLLKDAASEFLEP